MSTQDIGAFQDEVDRFVLFEVARGIATAGLDYTYRASRRPGENPDRAALRNFVRRKLVGDKPGDRTITNEALVIIVASMLSDAMCIAYETAVRHENPEN
jgi:hypothetical protein